MRQPFSVGGPLSVRITVGLGVAQGLCITIGLRIAHGERHTVRVGHALGRSVRRTRGPEPDRPEFPATSSNAAGLIVPSLAALAALGIAAGPGIQASANGSDLGNAVRRRLGRFRR